MAAPRFTEGECPFDVPDAGQPCKTWYKIFGDLSSGKRPLVLLHGGPGMSHDWYVFFLANVLNQYTDSCAVRSPFKHSAHIHLLPLIDLNTQHQTPLVFYDQLGTGHSTHLPHLKGNGSFWTPDLFISELLNLLSHLKITSYDILGQSWGGMLGGTFAAQHQPAGLNKLVISNSPVSMTLWLESAGRLRAALPQDVQDTLERCEKEDKIESPEYEAATDVFYKRHLCRQDPFPEDVQRTLGWVAQDPTVYHTMNGPTEFHVVGSLKSWSMIGEAHKIRVPTLLINGRYDEAQDSCVEPWFREIEKVKWITLEKSSHLPMWEERERYMEIVGDFLGLGQR